MEDAHAAVLDLQSEVKGAEHVPAPPDKRLAYFGVYDGHGGEKVAQFAGENIHKIIASQDAFGKDDMEQALKDGFLATDRAILTGQSCKAPSKNKYADFTRSEIRRGSLWLHRICRSGLQRQDLGGAPSVNYLLSASTDHSKANAGDSRSVLGVKGRAKPLSFDHKPQNEGQQIDHLLQTLC